MIAITGSHTGFLSSHLLKAIPESRSIPRFVRQDLALLNDWIKTENPSCVIHCAGLADVRRCMELPKEAFRINTLDTITLLSALEGRGTKLIYIATDKVYGQQWQCWPETHFDPVSAYDASKIAAEFFVYEFAKHNPCFIARFPNFYGPGDPHEERLFPSVLKAIKSKQSEFIVRTSADVTRQYIFINDAVEIIQKLVACADDRIRHHFGPPNIKTVRQVVMDMCEVFDVQMNLVERGMKGEATHLSLAHCTSLDVKFTEWETSLQSFKV